jgi:hypothetical protein
MRSKFVFCLTSIIENYLTPDISHMYSMGMGMGMGFFLFIYLFWWGRGGFWTFCNKAKPEIDYSLPLAFFFPPLLAMCMYQGAKHTLTIAIFLSLQSRAPEPLFRRRSPCLLMHAPCSSRCLRDDTSG